MSNSIFLHIRLSMMPYVRRPGTELWYAYFIYSIYYRSWIVSYGLSIRAALDKKKYVGGGWRGGGGGGKKALSRVFEAKGVRKASSYNISNYFWCFFQDYFQYSLIASVPDLLLVLIDFGLIFFICTATVSIVCFPFFVLKFLLNFEKPYLFTLSCSELIKKLQELHSLFFYFISKPNWNTLKP